MKNKSFTVTSEQINTLEVVEIDIPVTIESTTYDGDEFSKTYYPFEIQVINNTGADLKWNVILNESEYAEYIADDSFFDFIPLPKNSVLEDNKLFYKCIKFLVKGVEATASEDLEIVFINYTDI